MDIFAMSRLNGPLEITEKRFNKTEVGPLTWSFNNMGFLLFEALCCSFYFCALDLCRCPSFEL